MRFCSLTTECVLVLKKVFSYYRMCSFTTECVLVLQNVAHLGGWRLAPRAPAWSAAAAPRTGLPWRAALVSPPAVLPARWPAVPRRLPSCLLPPHLPPCGCCGGGCVRANSQLCPVPPLWTSSVGPSLQDRSAAERGAARPGSGRRHGHDKAHAGASAGAEAGAGRRHCGAPRLRCRESWFSTFCA